MWVLGGWQVASENTTQRVPSMLSSAMYKDIIRNCGWDIARATSSTDDESMRHM